MNAVQLQTITNLLAVAVQAEPIVAGIFSATVAAIKAAFSQGDLPTELALLITNAETSLAEAQQAAAGLDPQ